MARQDEYVPSIEKIPPGSIILTELPHLTREKFELAHKNVQDFLSDGPEDVDEFIGECERSNSVGLVVVHGRIPAMLEHLNGYKVFGVVVNETGSTLRANGLRVVQRLQKIQAQFIADIDALEDTSTRSEIDDLVSVLNEAERTRKSPEFEATQTPPVEGSIIGGPLTRERAS